MLRIVGIQRSDRVSEEFVLLQNHCSMRLHLRGHILVTEKRILNPEEGFIFVFPEDELIHSGAFVLLRAGYGDSRWGRTKEGALVYTTYLNQKVFGWHHTGEKIHISSIQHSYEERVLHLSNEPELEYA